MSDKKIGIPNIRRIAKLLPNQEFLRLYNAFQGNPDIFYLKPYFIERFGEKFLNYVMHGNETATKAMLNQCPEILTFRGNINLPSGTVTNVSALELIQEHTFILGVVLSHPYNMKDEDNRELFGNGLLYHVIRGNQDAVVAMLKRYPELLLYRGNVRDYSGREFKDVTAFELALWALDVRHMAPAMLKCLTENEEHKDYSKELVPDLQQQFDSVVKEGGGVNYTLGCSLLKFSRDPSQLQPDETLEQRDALLNRLLDRRDGCIEYNDRIYYFHNLSYPKTLVEIKDHDAVNALKGLMNKEGRKLEVDKLQIINNDTELKNIEKNVSGSQHIFKENHYDFKPLIDALDLYVHSFDDGSIWTEPQREAHWCTVVGLAQHYVPANIAQHYCNQDESFGLKRMDRYRKFDEKVLKRKLIFENLISRPIEIQQWWAVAVVPRSCRLGVDIGVSRGKRDIAEGTRTAVFWKGLPPAPPSIDFEALTALCEIRTAEMPYLKQLLDSLQKPDTGPGPSRFVLP